MNDSTTINLARLKGETQEVSGNLYLTINLLVLILGVACIGWGATWTGAQIVASLLVTLGGAMFGASATSIGGLVATRIFADRRSDLVEHALQETAHLLDESLKHNRRLLEDTVSASIKSREAALPSDRRFFHHYHVTYADGRLVWRYTTFDLTRSDAPGVLHALIKDVNPKDGREHEYDVECGVRDQRLFLLQKIRGGREDATVEVYPFFGSELHANCGIACRQTWDANHVVAPCLMTERKMADCDASGTVFKLEDQRSLTRLWLDGFGGEMLLTPSVLPSEWMGCS